MGACGLRSKRIPNVSESVDRSSALLAERIRPLLMQCTAAVQLVRPSQDQLSGAPEKTAFCWRLFGAVEEGPGYILVVD